MLDQLDAAPTAPCAPETRLGHPSFVKQRPDVRAGDEVGALLAVRSTVAWRAAESSQSKSKAELQPESMMRNEEWGAESSKCACISAVDSNIDEWIRSGTKQREPLVTVLMKHVVEVGVSTARFSSRFPRTALMYASGCGHNDVADYLLSRVREADVNAGAVEELQEGALAHASKRTQTRRQEAFDEIQAGIVNRLVRSGAYIEARDHNGCTALLIVAANGDTAVARQLLALQANVNAQDFEGHQPLDYAKKFDHDAMATLLLSAGARCNVGLSSAEPTGFAAQVPGRFSIADRALSPSSNLSPRSSEPEMMPPTSRAEASKERKEAKEEKERRKLSKKKTEKSLRLEDQEDGEKKKKKKKGNKDEKKPKTSKKAKSLIMEAVANENEVAGQMTVATEEPHAAMDSKQKAEKALKEAVEAKSVSKLEIAIQQARTCTVDPFQIHEAEEVLNVEATKWRRATCSKVRSWRTRRRP